MSDRTVHAVLADGSEVVRYDRAGKWYLEHPPSRFVASRRLTVREAAVVAMSPGAHARLALLGGQRFDALVRRMQRTEIR